jgi:hypothetical protein
MTTATRTFEVGQRWRDDSGYLMDVVRVEPNGDAWLRHPNSHKAAIYTLAAWASEWELLCEVQS